MQNFLTSIGHILGFISVGLFFYFRIWMFSKRLEKDLKQIIQTNKNIQERIKTKSLDI